MMKGIHVTHHFVRIGKLKSFIKFILTYDTPGGRYGRFSRWPPRIPLFFFNSLCLSHDSGYQIGIRGFWDIRKLILIAMPLPKKYL